VRRILFLGQHVALPADGIPPHGSGAHTAATLAGLRAHFEVRAVLGEEAGDAPARARPRGRRLVPQRLRGLRQDALLVLADRRYTSRALAEARAFRPDAVYERSEYLSLAGLRVARALQVPLVLEVNGLHDRDAKAMYRSWAEPLGTLVERLKHRRAAAVVTVTPGLADLLVERGARRDRIVVAPNSVEPSRVAAAPRAVRADSAVVGWVGHLMPWHVEALELLIEAASAVQAAVPSVEFRIIGGGPGLDRLRELAARRGLADAFSFLGSVSHDRVQEALADVDVGVIPAVFDYAFPVKLVEMGAIGLPVVAPQSASLDRLLAPGVEYEPFVAGSRTSFVERLIAVLADAGRRASLGAALHRATAERYTWAAVGATTARAIEHVIGPAA
jgi:glycosyltransferase involved in cell wall biosynthesis